MELQPKGLALDLNKINVVDNPNTAAGIMPQLSNSVKELDPKSKIGYHLARLVLAMIAAFLIFLMVYVFTNITDHHHQIDYTNLMKQPDSTLNKKLTIIKSIQSENKESRDFVIQISQMVLLNILLPILTAILGYIFGSHHETKDN